LGSRFTTLAEYLPDPNGYRTDALEDITAVYPSPQYPTYASYVAAVNQGGGSRRNLTLAGLYFGIFESVIEVSIGDPPNLADCPIVPGSLVELPILSTDTVGARWDA
jgi:hypothetical protein